MAELKDNQKQLLRELNEAADLCKTSVTGLLAFANVGVEDHIEPLVAETLRHVIEPTLRRMLKAISLYRGELQDVTLV